MKQHVIHARTHNDRFSVIESTEIEQRGLIYAVRAAWPGNPPEIPLNDLGDVLAYDESEGRFFVIQSTDDGLINLSVSSGSGNISVSTYASDLHTAHRLMVAVRNAVPLTEVGDTELRVSFWALSPHGAFATQRVLAAPAWESIASNYGHNAARALTRLAGMRFDPESGGKLLLWHGPPGTGKTYALRALAQEWRGWANVQYIIDPERFFGEASYMQTVLLSGQDDYASSAIEIHVENGSPTSGGVAPTPRTPSEPKWRLVVLEDTGELLANDAKERTGQGLSRLLNLCDGMIGQGLRVLVLITTNEDLGRLHPAVTRPGRCVANVQFGSLSAAEADIWLAAHGGDAALPSKERSLAELYEIVGARDRVVAIDQRQTIGFGLRP